MPIPNSLFWSYAGPDKEKDIPVEPPVRRGRSGYQRYRIRGFDDPLSRFPRVEYIERHGGWSPENAVNQLGYSAAHPNVPRLEHGQAFNMTSHSERGAIQGVVALRPIVEFATHGERFLNHHAQRSTTHRAPNGFFLIERTFCTPVEINGMIIYIGIHRYPPRCYLLENLPAIHADVL